jgi:D-alanyl-D-alanine dipeptidase
MKIFITAFFLITPLIAHAQSCPAPAIDALKNSTQLVAVTASSWDTPNAQLRLWQRKSTNDRWKPASRPLPAVVGSKGVGWGFDYRTLAGASGQPIKHEGDGRSPAGVFKIGVKFGCDANPSTGYLQLKESTVCVDDTASAHYNTLVDSDGVKKDWNSAEEMRKIDLYRHGAVIDYRTSASAKAGSCIFFHIWSAPDKGTSGCTAVAEDTMAQVQKWLRDDGHGSFLLAPKSELAKFVSCLPGVESMDISL